MKKILVIIDIVNKDIHPGSLETLGVALNQSDCDVSVAMVGDFKETLLEEFTNYKISNLFYLGNESLNLFDLETNAHAILEVIKANNFNIILGPHTPHVRNLIPYLAAKLNATAVANIHDLKVLPNKFEIQKSVFAGKAQVQQEIQAETLLASIKLHTFSQAKKISGNPPKRTQLPLPQVKSRLQFINKAVQNSGKDVIDADVIVAGGRSLKTAENFKILFDLAETLHGSVGATRAAVDLGLMPIANQIGQTGKIVSPQLYIAFGISGAIQHIVGMKNSKFVIAINVDPNAPIFQYADVAIVGDLFTLAPLITTKLKENNSSLNAA